MALESFYGGKPGVSPVIKARFKYIDTNDAAYKTAASNGKTVAELKPFTMSECFADLSYKDVWYDELCIIDTDNKFNPNNGKIYRRTLEPNNGLHAEYLGQIVGPSGGAAKISIGSINNAKTEAVKNFNEEDQYVYIDSNTQEQTTKSPGPADEHGNGNANAIATLTASPTGNNITMVPGKEPNSNTYHNEIRYTWCNVRRNGDNSLEDVWLYLGFEIPYTSWDVQTQTIDYWDNRTSLITDGFTTEHPFYHNLTFYIPRGTRGIGPEEIYVVGKNGRTKPEHLYTADSIIFNEKGNFTIKNPPTEYVIRKENDPETPEENKIYLASETYWVARYNLYNPGLGYTESNSQEADNDSQETGNNSQETNNQIPKYYDKTVDIFICDYNDVKSVELGDNGTLTFTGSNGKTLALDQKIKWIKNITTDFQRKETIIKENGEEEEQDHSAYGNMTIWYNTLTGENPDKKTVKIPLIKDIELDVDRNSSSFGLFTIENNQEENSIFLSKTIPFVKRISYNEDATPNPENSTLTDEGTISVQYAGIQDPEKLIQLKYVKGMSYSTDTTPNSEDRTITDEGSIYVQYTGEANPTKLAQLKYVKGMSYNTNTDSEDGNTTKEGTISVQYTGEASPTELTQLKYVKGISYNTDVTPEEGKTTTKEGTISVQYTGEANPTELVQLKYVKGMSYIEDATPNSEDANITNEGSIYVQYTGKQNPEKLTQLKYVKGIEYDNTIGSTGGTISVQYTGEANPTKLAQLKYVKNIVVNDNTQQLSYIDNTGTSIALTTWLNIVKEFCIDERGHLLAYYNSSEYRPNINIDIATYSSKDNLYCYAQNNPQNHFSNAQNWVYPIDTNKQKVKIAGWWHDLGEVYNQSGIHIVAEYTWSFENIDPNYDPPCTVDNILALFNGTLKKAETDEEAIESPYPNGEITSSQTNIDLTGGIVCVKKMENPSDTTTLVTGLFSYNYEKGEWFYLGNWEDVGGQESASVRIVPYSWKQDNILPLSTDVNPIITFVTKEEPDSIGDITEVLGSLPWENFSE